MYIAAQFRLHQTPNVFKIGDEQSYSGYLNGTLDSDSYYGLFMTGITKTKSGVS